MNRVIRPLLASALVAACLAHSVGAAGPEPLHHYGVALLGDGKSEAEFASRFNAQGRPLFLISDLGRGVAIGDIIRFRNKVVLIDEEVWQTMKATGVLAGIRNVPVVALSAKSTGAVWKSRAQLAEGREKIAYTLGAEFLTVLEEYFGSIPERMEIAFRFDGDKMTLLAPADLLGVLRFVARDDKSRKEKPPVRSQPTIISEPPRDAFTGEPFAWTVWAVDPGYPSQELRYTLESTPPPGLAWDELRHALVGTPSRAGTFGVRVRAANAAGRSDTRAFPLVASAHPEPVSRPEGGLAFRSALSAASLMQGQPSFYAPVAVGPGRDIRYASLAGETRRPLPADGRIPLATESPGRYLLEVSAEDELGNRATQVVAYQVLPREALPRNLALRSTHLGGASLVEASYRLGRARFGALQAGLRAEALPFFFAGFEPLPAAAAGGRHALFLDMGFNAMGRSGLTYGGLFLRLDGRYNRFGIDPYAFAYSAHYHARQGIVLFNPQEFKENDLGNRKVESCLQELRSRTDRTDSLVADFLECHDGADRLISAYADGDNQVFLLDFALWLSLGHAFGAGPVYWLEDHFHTGRNVEQRLGAGLAHHAAWRWLSLEAAAKVGFANAPHGLVKFQFDLGIRFGGGE